MSEDVLDNHDLDNHSADICYKNGSSFSFTVKGLALVFAFIGLAMIGTFSIVGMLLGPAITFGSIFVITSNFGTEISLSTKYIREYHERYFIKSGRWVPMNLLPDICIIKIGKTTTHSDITGAVSTEIDKSKNEVYLMSGNHRKRVLIKTCSSIKEAAAVAEEMAIKLDKKFTKFNPQISKQTQAKLRHRR